MCYFFFSWREATDCADIMLATIHCCIKEPFEWCSCISDPWVWAGMRSQTTPVILTPFGPGSAYLDIVIDASRLVQNASKIPELFRLKCRFKTYIDSARVRAPAGHRRVFDTFRLRPPFSSIPFQSFQSSLYAPASVDSRQWVLCHWHTSSTMEVGLGCENRALE